MATVKDGDIAKGACFCGAVTFEITLPALFCGHCHCTMCQRAHGAGFVTWTGVDKDHFELLSGEKELVEFASSDHGKRSFCGICGSTLFCESTNRENHVEIVLANISDDIGLEPSLHFYYDYRAPWIKINDDLTKVPEGSP